MNKEFKSVVIVIPDYPDKVQTAKARRPVYYVHDPGLVGKNIIPKRYKGSDYGFDKNGRLYDKRTGEHIISNPRTAGKPRYWVVNFQDIWNGNMSKHSRNNNIGLLKDILRPYIKKVRVIKEFPLEMSIKIYDMSCNVDISNKGVIYTKIIEDLLVTEGKIPDDSVKYINSSGRMKFVQITDQKKKRMEITITKSDNK